MTLPSYAENVRESLVDPSSLPGVDAHGVQALQTYAACVNDVVQRVESADADVRSAIQDYQGQVSTAQGNRINQLTLVSIIFLPISFLTGYFGMNFQYLVNETQSFVDVGAARRLPAHPDRHRVCGVATARWLPCRSHAAIPCAWR